MIVMPERPPQLRAGPPSQRQRQRAEQTVKPTNRHNVSTWMDAT